MRNILPGISTLGQHVKLSSSSTEDYRPATCSYCGKAGLHLHGDYSRKVDRDGSLPKDTVILIPRFQCPNCHRTCWPSRPETSKFLTVSKLCYKSNNYRVIIFYVCLKTNSHVKIY